MKAQSIPLYAADGTSLGFRSLEAARRLIANEVVNPVYGRKGHLKAIFFMKPDGSSAVESKVPMARATASGSDWKADLSCGTQQARQGRRASAAVSTGRGRLRGELVTRKAPSGGRHIARERGLFPAWSGWPFRRALRNATATLPNPKARRAQASVEPTKGPKPCQA